jgi:glycosyltransferase involved in cell wall biosynthesis
MKVLFLWNNYSGYMAACWRALQSLDVDCHVRCFTRRPTLADPLFEKNLLDGLNYKILSANSTAETDKTIAEIGALRPDAIAIAGWESSVFRHLLRNRLPFNAKKILCMDNPFRGDLRQAFGRVYFKFLTRSVDAFAVPGERGFQLAKYLGAAEHKIFRGLYGVDEVLLGSAAARRSAQVWPKSLVFVGRYEERKGVDLLLSAFDVFNRGAGADWRLLMVGNGPLESLIKRYPTIDNRGFCTPEKLRDVLSEAGAFILPSRYDAWPLSLVEAASSGLPIIATNACGSAVELLRHGHNGFFAATNSTRSLSEMMLKVASHYTELPLFGERSQRLADAWSASAWARRWKDKLQSLLP